ncbi:hypothetical protein AAVH_26593, partial [Aphelenchoides avenae]
MRLRTYVCVSLKFTRQVVNWKVMRKAEENFVQAAVGDKRRAGMRPLEEAVDIRGELRES